MRKKYKGTKNKKGKVLKAASKKIRKINTKKKSKPVRGCKNKVVAPVSCCQDIYSYYKNTADSKWFIIELRENVGIDECHEAVEARIKNVFGPSVNYFIPVHTERIKNDAASVTLFDGYVFVQSTPIVEDNIKNLKNEYIKGPLSVDPSHYYYVNNNDINDFKKKIQKTIKNMTPKKGDSVIPRVGVFSNLVGKVLSVDKKGMVATVEFKRSTRIVETPINIINLVKADPENCEKIYNRRA